MGFQSLCQAVDGFHPTLFMVVAEMVFPELYEWGGVHWEKELVDKEFSAFSEVVHSFPRGDD